MTYNFVEIKTHLCSSTKALAKKIYIYIYQDVQIPGQRELQQQYVGQLVLSSLTVPAPSQESSAKKTIAQVWIGLLVLVIRDKLCPNLTTGGLPYTRLPCGWLPREATNSSFPFSQKLPLFTASPRKPRGRGRKKEDEIKRK